MTFADGITMENMTDPFLVYTETEVLSHVNVQDCRSGEQVSLDLMVQGPEGIYTFWIYRAFSTDGGNQYLRDKDPLETFALDSRGQKPHTKRDLTVEAEEKGMIRFEVLVQTPDLAQIQFSSDPVRVKPAAYSV